MKKRSLKMIIPLLLILTLLLSVNSSDAAIESFSGYMINTNGDASVVSGALQLTPDEGSRRGSAFINQSFALTSSTSFSSAFSFRITGGTNGGDGLVFMLQNDEDGLNALGGAGGFLGYESISPSIAVEFDTYGSDPSNNHIGININGSLTSVQLSESIPDLNSGNTIYAWVEYYSSGDGMFDVFVSDSPAKPLVPQLAYPVNLASLLGSTFYTGFSAATGGSRNAHLIDSWSFDLLCDWVGEAAWSDGSRYVQKGNWATYTPYVSDDSVTLYAGQSMEAGTVHFSAVDDGYVTITITLNAGWRFADVEENVKVEGYEVPPIRKPKPGKFTWKDDADTSPYEIVVDAAGYYGVQVDVEWADCSVPE